MEYSAPTLFMALIVFALLALAGVYYIQKKRAAVIRAGEVQRDAIIRRAQRHAEKVKAEADEAKSKIIADGEIRATNLITEAETRVLYAEYHTEKLKSADVDLQSRLKAVRSRLETLTNIAGEQAGSIEMISEYDLHSSQRYQSERKKIRTMLKKAAIHAVRNVKGYPSDMDIGKHVAISARSDLAGALLLTTTEMLCAKATANNGHASIEKLHDSIRATGALLKAVSSDLALDQGFVSLLEQRLRIEINYKRAKQIARDRQRELRAEEREERKAREEAKEAERSAALEEEIKRMAIAELEAKMVAESEEERAQHRYELQRLKHELVLAQGKVERARSRAQYTKQGHVYIISNIGSFGENVLKIGVTRRLNPLDRIKELGDASVPFTFDIHALIESEDAPALEKTLHQMFDDRRFNKVNRRKEYFRVSVQEIESSLVEAGVDAMVIPVASADEYYATMELENQT